MKKLYTSFSLLLAALVLSATAQAQLVSGNLFLKGRYVEAAMQPIGAFGSTESTPAGYHSHSGGSSIYCTSSGVVPQSLGFVSDPAMDGWDVGTPAYCGDFFTPGSPWEGWAISMDGDSTVTANSTDCGFSDSSLTGGFIAYNEVGSTVLGIWKGMLDSLEITKTTVLDTNSLYFYTRVTFTNLSSIPHNDIYYMRAFDPDNTQTWTGGSFTTKNIIEHQLPNTLNATTVSAWGTGVTISGAGMSYVAMGSVDSNAKCMIFNSWPMHHSRSIADAFNETSSAFSSTYYAEGDTVIGDIAIAIMFHIDHLAPVDSATDSVGRTTARPANSITFTYFHSFSPAATDSAIKHLQYHTVVDTTASVTAINNMQKITAYPNPTKTFVTINDLTKGDKVSCLDLTGRSVGEEIIADLDGQKQYNLQNLQAGFYLLVITDKQGNIISRIRVEKQ